MSPTGGESRYQRLHVLGRGGTAEVTTVYWAERRLKAALKTPLPGSAESQRIFSQLAAREAHLIGGEHFPGLVRLLDYDADSDASLLLELCDGPTVDRIGRIEDWSVLLNVFSSLALDLAFLKARGIVHADIKPHNFFLPADWQQCRGRRLFHAKLSDFSLGRFDSEPDEIRAGAGTVGYMAPETIRDGRTSHQSDLFALGVIAYQLVSGQHPFLHDDCEPVRVNSRVTEEEPPLLKDIRPDIPDGLSELISSLIAKKESNRPQSAIEICTVLEKIGAEYPFRKAIRPTDLMVKAMSYEDALASVVNTELAQSPFLTVRTQSDLNSLRLFLTANWRRGAIRFDGNRFSANGELHWPLRMRNQLLERFSSLPYSAQRQAIIQAVLHDSDSESQLSATPLASGTSSCPALSELLLQLLRIQTVKRIAKAYVVREDRAGNYQSASRLYLTSGDLSQAERCALDAAVQLRAQHAAVAAMRTLRRVISFAELRGDLFAVRQSLMHTGDILKEIGEADRALHVYRQIVDLYDGRPSDCLLAETYKDLGDLYKMKQEVRFGIEALELALAIYRELHNDVEISHTLNNLGNMHWINSDASAALLHYRAALRIQRRHKAEPEVASTLNNIASIYTLRSRFGRGIRLLKLVLALNRERGDAGEIARTLNNMGYAHAVAGQAADAVECLKESLVLNRRIGSRKEQLFNLENLSEITLLLGRVKESVHFLDEGLELAAELRDKPHQATFHLTSANAYLRLGHAAKAMQSLGSARSFLDQIDGRPMEVAYLILNGRIRLFIGDCQQALVYAGRAVDVASSLGDHISRLSALLLAERLGDDAGVVSEAESIVAENNLKREHLLLAFDRIERMLETGDATTAQAIYESVEESAEALSEDIDMPRINILRAEILLEQGKSADAVRCLERGLARARMAGLAPELANGLALRARIENQQRAFEMSFASARQALQVIRQLAENISNEDDRAIFLNRRSVQNLMIEVRRLGAILGQKQRAE